MRDKFKLINLPKITDPRGNLSFLEEEGHFPFKIERVYWIYDIPGDEERGGHAYKKEDQIIIALSGSFDVVLDNGETKEKISLNRSYKALFVPSLTWRTLENFSTNSVVLVLSSSVYNEEDYIRDYEKFKALC